MKTIFSDDNFRFEVSTQDTSMTETQFGILVAGYADRWYDMDEYPEYEDACIGDVVAECFLNNHGIEVEISDIEEGGDC